ncbi:hypothetical protein [Flammeovirga aprica]|uniref:DUF4382 domain-containing protein n=1 Tax=Flammeovirga aprica JL-4 TaxID=694437 RepID=A0A7X9S069_9BACT|nr:hypothetical protein [Flammeovirga aprica]NME71985.1 hypothetical protein [Flammeovirga aprica JL-4]
MRKNLIYFLALLFLGFMTSCSDDEDPAASTPTIDVSGVPTGDVVVGQFTDSLIMNVNADEKIESLLLTLPWDEGQLTTDLAMDPSEQGKPDNTQDHIDVHQFIFASSDADDYKDVEGEKQVRLVITPTVLNLLDEAGVLTITLKVTDKKDMSTTGSATITIVDQAVAVGFSIGNGVITGDTLTTDYGTVLTINPTSNAGTAIETVTVNGTTVAASDGKYNYTLVNSDTLKVIATDANGIASEETMLAVSLNLKAAEAFTWQRVGAADGTGLDKYGLTWTSNSATNAIVKSASTTKLVQLAEADWTGITTQSQLAAAVMAGTGIDQYEGVSVTASGTYNDVLATEVTADGGAKTYYLINVTNGTVTTSEQTGTTVTIMGESRDDLYATISEEAK